MEIEIIDDEAMYSAKQVKKAHMVVNKVFEILAVICPAYKQAWPTDRELAAAKKQWVLAIAANQELTGKLINHGLFKLRKRNLPFIPSPGEFIQLCMPTHEELSLPIPQKAFEEACRNCHPACTPNWTHETIYAAAMATGSHELSTLPSIRIFPVFERNYEIAIRNYVDGKKVRIPKALPEMVQNKPNPVIARMHLEKIRKILKG